jgi:allantoicase
MQDSEQHGRQMAADHSIPDFASLADLASARLGGRAVFTNDDFFAPRANLLKPEAPVFIAGKFTSRGKWMDGWESRRRRVPGHDWCVVRLGVRGSVRGFDVDTSFFTGNYPSHCSVDALDTARPVGPALAARSGEPWTPLLAKVPLGGDRHNYFDLASHAASSDAAARPWTHLRLNIFPDGGVARLRAYGDVVMNWGAAGRTTSHDLAAITNGGLVLGASDMHFGAKDNMIMPGRARNMGDGWETRRRRGPGFDWAIVRLGAPGLISRIELDTNHFKGNYPDSASIDACLAPEAGLHDVENTTWTELLPQTKLQAHHRHFFTRELRKIGAVSHVRLNIYPDGGISRFRVHGTLAPA